MWEKTLRNATTYVIFAAPPKDEALRAKLLTIVEHAARHPDRGSDFDRATLDIRNAPRDVLLQKLYSRGYDCIVAVDGDGEFLGMVGYQDHRDGSRHSFSYHVPEHLQGFGIGMMLVGVFLETAFKANIYNVRVYAGNIRGELSAKNDATMKHLFDSVVVNNAMKLPFDIQPGDEVGWVKLGQPASAVA